MKILVTGFGGFIGYTLVKALRSSHQLQALDNFSSISNYDIKLARAADLGIGDFEGFRNAETTEHAGVAYHYADLCQPAALDKIFANGKFDLVVHLAALTGVRQSVANPQVYIDTNVKGFINLLEAANKHGVKNIIYASSSSVYGKNTETPYAESQRTDAPISVYAASKKADELLAEVYASLYNINLVGLRFFTVYGPWTRPDMAAYIFMKAIYDGTSIDLYNGGEMIRDFTYVGDVVKALLALIEEAKAGQLPRHEVYNVGNHSPILTIQFLQTIEGAMGKKAVVEHKPMQPGDMPATNAATDKLHAFTGFRPDTNIASGVKDMVEWFLSYYPATRKR